MAGVIAPAQIKEVRTVKVKVTKRYNDLAQKKIQEVGAVIEVADVRGKYLISQGIAEELKEDTKEQKPECQKDSKAAKNTGKD